MRLEVAKAKLAEGTEGEAAQCARDKWKRLSDLSDMARALKKQHASTSAALQAALHEATPPVSEYPSRAEVGGGTQVQCGDEARSGGGGAEQRKRKWTAGVSEQTTLALVVERAELDAMRLAMAAERSALDAMRVEVDEGNLAMAAERSALDAMRVKVDEGNLALAAERSALDAMRVEVDEANLALDAMRVKVDEGNLALAAERSALDAMRVNVDEANLALAAGRMEGKKKLCEQLAQLIAVTILSS